MFSGGGMLAALLLPALVAVLALVGPLGWVELADYDALLALWRNPLVRLLLFVFLTLSFFHWAHRFRYTLYDGLQLYHLNELIAVLTYGVATALTALTAFTVWVVL